MATFSVFCEPVDSLPQSGTCGFTYSFIGGGTRNSIDDAAAATSFGVVGGGQANTICAGTNHSSIFSGNGNIVSGSCSSILGGSGNNDNGFPYTGMYGNGLIAAAVPGAPSSFWVDTLVAPNIPVVNAITFIGLPFGALYTNVAAGAPFLGRPIYVK